MRFLELRLKPFGRFENEVIRFTGDLHPTGGLHMIIGPNEAGKSTTLAAFERFFFGFPRNDIYNILRKKNLWIGSDLQLDSGEKIGLWRRNSKVSLFGENQTDALPANLLENYLNPIDSKTYMSLFGLNQDKLREGGKKLVSGEGEFADLLFGESLGDLHLFNNIRKSLRKEADELFKLDGRARTPLNTLRARIEELNSKLQESATRTSVWAELETGRNSVRRELDQMKAEKEVIIRGISSVKNRLASRTHVNELKTLKAELIPLTGLPDADEKMRQEMNEAIIRLSQ
ncbi:MAG: AAA family ATPase, partial [bacterium]